MEPIADSCLRHLRDQRLRVAQQQAQYGPGAVKFIFQELCPQAISVTPTLYDRPARSGIAAHEDGNAQYPLVANHRDFSRRAVLQKVKQRDDGPGGEVDVLQVSARLVKHFPDGHRNKFQMLRYAIEFGLRESSKQVILLGVVRRSHCNASGGAIENLSR